MFLSFETGGAATYQAQNINFLLSRGHQVVLVDERPEFTMSKVNGLLSSQLQIIHAPVWSSVSETSVLIATLSGSAEKIFFVLSNPVLLVRYYLVLAQAAKQGMAKVAITIHSGMLTMTWRRYLLEWAASFACLRLDDIIYVSHFTRCYWERRYPWMRWGRVRVVPNGVYLPLAVTPRRKPDRLKVGFVGRVHREKDPALFCETARLAKRQSLPFDFHLFGDGPLRAELEREYTPCVEWHGQVESTEAIYSNIDILLMTSPIENCPLALLEAKSYGIPVVSAPVGGITEITEHGVDSILASKLSAESLLFALEEAQCCYAALSQGCLKTRGQYCAESLGQVTWKGRGIF